MKNKNLSSINGLVGSTVPNSDFANFWGQVASIYKTNIHVIFGLMNEPNTMPTEQLVTSLCCKVVYVIHHGILGKGYARNMKSSEQRNEFLNCLTQMRGPPCRLRLKSNFYEQEKRCPLWNHQTKTLCRNHV